MDDNITEIIESSSGMTPQCNGVWEGNEYKKFSSFGELRQSAVAEEAIKPPQSETTPLNEKSYSTKITSIVDQISSLNLLEVADLNELLKTKLKIR